MSLYPRFLSFFFFFNDTATTEIYTLSLHDALPISRLFSGRVRDVTEFLADIGWNRDFGAMRVRATYQDPCHQDRKSTRLNSSHLVISYAVFCLKKKKKK